MSCIRAIVLENTTGENNGLSGIQLTLTKEGNA